MQWPFYAFRLYLFKLSLFDLPYVFRGASTSYKSAFMAIYALPFTRATSFSTCITTDVSGSTDTCIRILCF